MKITKKQFLADVKHEIEMLKLHATEEEKSRLNFETFDPTHISECIYGQMTKSCTSKRAKELMDLSCIRVMHTSEDGALELFGTTFKYFRNKINGKNEGQGWLDNGGKHSLFISSRNWAHLSALEGYINLKDANNKNVLAYIKGETDKLKL